MSKPIKAGTTEALNHVNQAEGTTTPSSVASFMHSRFCAAAVRNMAEELTEPWNWVLTKKAPSLSREGSLGLLPEERESELMMGMKIPPARAVVEGMAGAMSASAMERP